MKHLLSWVVRTAVAGAMIGSTVGALGGTAHASGPLTEADVLTAPLIGAGTDPCTTNAAIQNVKFTVVDSSTVPPTTQTLTYLRGQLKAGEQVTVSYDIAPSCSLLSVKASLVSYRAPLPYFTRSSAPSQIVHDAMTVANSAPTGNTMTVTVPPCYYQVDFVRGDVITSLGGTNPNNFYTPQGRLISADNGGTRACTTVDALVSTGPTALPGVG